MLKQAMAAPGRLTAVLLLPASRNGWLTSVRFCAHNGLKSDVTLCPKCAARSRHCSDPFRAHVNWEWDHRESHRGTC
jgi:hypothetical protein